MFLPEGSVPRTRLCRIHGSEILDSNNVPCVHIREMSAEYVYSILGGNKVILKPSIDSNSGKGIIIFVPEDNRYISYDGRKILDTEIYQ